MSYSLEPIYEMYVYETKSLLMDFEIEILEGNVYQRFTEGNFESIYTILQKMNGSARRLLFTSIYTIVNAAEDIIYYMITEKIQNYNFTELALLLFEVCDFIKNEIRNLINQLEHRQNPLNLENKIARYFLLIYRNNIRMRNV